MKNIDMRTDKYIEKAEPFAKPILIHLRKLIHATCPEVVETIKWGMPSFEYKGALCSMASFKQHAVFGFRKERLMPDVKKFTESRDYAMGSFGRITKLSDLPPDATIKKFIKEAMRLNEKGVKVPQGKKSSSQDLSIPDYFLNAITRDKKALATFERFSYSNKKEYVEWITGAKSDHTREKRMALAVEWMVEGKPRMWKYMK